LNEFDLIERFFVRPNTRSDVVVGIGDDAAVCQVPDGHEVVVTTDMLVEGVHFPGNTPPDAIGHKSLAVNISDLAAMGATPAWFTLTLSLPETNEKWLQEFSSGLLSLADTIGIALIGGDTVEGPLSIGIQACGLIPTGTAVLRSGANVGDHIIVTGDLGDAALGIASKLQKLNLPTSDQEYFSQRLNYPSPRYNEGIALRNIASAMIDISDGFVADLGHVLDSSGVGARIELAKIPVSKQYRDLVDQVRWDPALSGGDDYELCFTVAPGRVNQLKEVACTWDCGIKDIGRIEQETGLRIFDEKDHAYKLSSSGYEHFSS